MKFLPLYLIFFISCQHKGQLYKAEGENLAMHDTSQYDEKLNDLISPYRQKMAAEMNTVIGKATTTLNNSKTSKESDLGNWVADVVFETGMTFLSSLNSEIKKHNCMALINKGGIRAPINAGPITTGNIYEVMPFNNEIVIVKLEPKKVKEILDYLYAQNGQPISNAMVRLREKIKTLTIAETKYNLDSPLYIITSDYLAKGGDNMNFFKNPISTFQTGILIRDALLKKVKNDQMIIAPKNSGRITFIHSYE